MDSNGKDDKNNLDNLENNYKKAEELGYKIQKDGLGLVRAGKMGQEIVSYFRQNEENMTDLEEGEKSSDLSKSIQHFRKWVEASTKTVPQQVHKLEELTGKEVFREVAMVNNSASSGYLAVSTLCSGIESFHDEYPQRNVYFEKAIDKPKLFYYRESVQDLDEKLEKINSDWPKRRKGAWDAFNSVSSDKLAQASHTMRDILSKLISKWASNDDVKRSGWWANADNTESGVSLKQRIRYLLYGPTDIINTQELENIYSQIDYCYEQDKLLKKVAHGSSRFRDRVEAAMKAIEMAMLSIINERQTHL